jgi:DNA-binding response OmpR family regulator
MKSDREKALAVGADDYVPKPIDFATLTESMQHWLEREIDLAINGGSRAGTMPIDLHSHSTASDGTLSPRG